MISYKGTFGTLVYIYCLYLKILSPSTVISMSGSAGSASSGDFHKVLWEHIGVSELSLLGKKRNFRNR